MGEMEDRNYVRTMRVLELYDADGPSGVSHIARQISQGLRTRGHSVLRMHSGECSEGDTPLYHRGCIDSSLHSLLSLCIFIRRQVIAHSIDVIHVHQRRLAIAAQLAVYGLGVPVAEHVHSTFSNHRRLSFRAQASICLTNSLQDELEKFYPHTSGKTYVCQNGVALPTFISRPPAGTPLRLLSIGRVESAKGPKLFAQLILDLRARGIDVEGVWLGEGPLLESMRASTQFCAWPGAVDNVRDWIEASDCLVCTSTREGIPLSMLEAMAAGRPVLTPQIGGIPDLIDESVGVAWAREEPYADTIDKIAAFLTDNARRITAGEAAHRRIAVHWREDQMVDCVEATLRSLL
jgi:glycosyltransferase involved in cell wall biosynthesis